jgi:hypothetical protein
MRYDYLQPTKEEEMTHSDDIYKNNPKLLELLQKAERDKQLIKLFYTGEVFTPAELRARNSKGQWIAGVVNFELVTPRSRIAQLQGQIERDTEIIARKQKEIEDLKAAYGQK